MCMCRKNYIHAKISIIKDFKSELRMVTEVTEYVSMYKLKIYTPDDRVHEQNSCMILR